ncbi:MAG: tryptophan synthase subunit alpha [Fimbriimonadaceae bacterium]|nr:tryptophan synthase subunit alpha [Fimbriimonadaceae bacterium]
MSPIAARFAGLKSKGDKALVLFVTAGDPALDQLPEVLLALQEGGADLIEVGIPFSDPIADGPTIQASSQRALDRGVTPRQVLETLASVRLEVPVVLMGYLNPILRIGSERFADMAAKAGASGTIVSDLTPEESDEWRDVSRRYGLDNVFLVAPTSTDERIQIAADRASGFVYAVSRTGVTGAQQSAPPEVADLVGRIRARTNLPVCVGFGISTPEHVRMVCEVADGAVVGSWLVDFLATNWQNGVGQDKLIEAIRGLKAATQQHSAG